MKENPDYKKDISEIRSMMERSTKFLSLSGLAGIMAGLYALAGSYIAFAIIKFDPAKTYSAEPLSPDLVNLIVLATAVLILAVGTAIALSFRQAIKTSEPVWNATTRRLLTHMGLPLITAGILMIIFISKGLMGLLAPVTLIFYGLALYSAGNFTYSELKNLGIILIALGLAGAYIPEYGLFLWATGFGLMHIVYGIYIYLRHQR